MKRLLLVLPLAGCPHHGSTPATPPGEAYAGMFEQQRGWTYKVDETTAEGVTSYEVTCEVAAAIDVDGGRMSLVSCDGTLGDGMQEAVAGLWAEDARGVFYLPDLTPDGDLAGPLPKAEMVDFRMMLAAKPAAGPIGNLTIEETPEGWCRSDRTDAPDLSWTRVCFTNGVITSGQLGWNGEVHAVTFAETE